MIVCLFVYTLTLVVDAHVLVQGNVIWRHGDRSPHYTYPNDPYKDLWTDGPYQLTETGKYQMYELGLYLKSKYGHLLSKRYRSHEIFIKSTDLDRSKMSAQCIAAALYSPCNVTEWKGVDTPWIPFPLHTTEASQDWFAKMYQNPEKGCPEFHSYLESLQADDINDINEKYAAEFSYISRMSGVKEEFNFKNYFLMHDNLLCLQANNYSLPAWVDDQLMETLDQLSALYVASRFTDLGMKHVKLLSKLRTGVILEHVIDNMRKWIRGEHTLSFIGYSGHDWSIAAILISMGAYNWIVPPYASCVMLDLYKESDGTYCVEFWYRNDSTSKPTAFSFYGCGHKCSFDRFLLTASSVSTDGNTESLCINSNYIDHKLASFILVFLVSISFMSRISCK